MMPAGMTSHAPVPADWLVEDVMAIGYFFDHQELDVMLHYGRDGSFGFPLHQV